MSQEPAAETATQVPGKPAKPKIFYGWWIALAGFVASFLNQGIFTIGPSAYIAPLRDEMAWSAAAIALGFSIRQFEQGLLGPLFGYLIDRYGPRPLATIGIFIKVAGLLMFSQVDNLWQFYGASLVMAVGQSMGSTQAYTAALVHWFRRKRGTASAIMGAGTAMGYVGVYPITLLLALYGWRSAALATAILYFVVTLPLAQLIRHKPQQYGLLPDGDTAPPGDGAATQPERHGRSREREEGFSVLQAMKTRAFWMVLVARAFYGLTTNVHHVHQIPHLINRGFSTTGAGLFVTIYGIEQVAARLLSGPLGDTFGRFRLFRNSFLLLGLGWVFFANLAPGAWWVIAGFFVTYGFGHAAHTVAGQALLADYFGPRRYATISGLMSPMSLAISVLGPIYGGVMYDIFGSYYRAFMIMGPIIAMATVAMYWAGTPTMSGERAAQRALERGGR